VGTVTKALAATGKALGASLKEIGTKLGSMLPGLIGQVSFQNRGAGGQLSRRAHLAADPCRGGIFIPKIYQKAALTRCHE